MQFDDEWAKWIASGSVGTGLFFYIGRVCFRLFGKDKLELTKDRVETNLVQGQYSRIKDLETDNRALVNQLLEKAEEVGALRGQVKALTIRLEHQDEQIAVLTVTIEKLQINVEKLMSIKIPDNVIMLPARDEK